MRRKRKREEARAALDGHTSGHTVLSTGSRLEIVCDSERWYPATVMARAEDGDGRIVHEVEYDGTRIGGGGTWTTSGGAPSYMTPSPHPLPLLT